MLGGGLAALAASGGALAARAERHANQWAHAWANSWGAPSWSHHGAPHQRPQPPAPPPPPQSRGIPDDEMRRVLDLVEAGKLSAEDAQKLLKAMQR
ncbi:SHOCT-like domain-containing protein [Corallococcus sp. 4LFB]|uniref:SHOCT-like domain-containing protein n=1 Tax=Corallococcus sp. 4LFB TaxID=3383249 RepID=UPI00397637D8